MIKDINYSSILGMRALLRRPQFHVLRHGSSMILGLGALLRRPQFHVLLHGSSPWMSAESVLAKQRITSTETTIKRDFILPNQKEKVNVSLVRID